MAVLQAKEIFVPEYLTMFDGGDIQVRVEFSNFSGRIAERSMRSDEVIRFACLSGEQFLEKMRFDDWAFNIEKYEIRVKEKLVVIHAY